MADPRAALPPHLRHALGGARVWKEVRLDAIRRNAARVAQRVGPAARVMAVVKAGGYGHGLVEAAAAALAGGAARLGVATVEEAACLRDASLRAPIHLLGALAPGEADALVPLRVVPFIHEAGEVAELARAARRAGRRLPVHLKVDTGMGRLGARPDDASALAERILAEPALRLAGVATHLAAADAPDLASARAQLARLAGVLAAPPFAAQRAALTVHAGASAAIARLPEARFDLVRPGLLLYGLAPVAGRSRAVEPALALRSRVAFVKSVPAGAPLGYGGRCVTERATRVATIACGYHDGYPLLTGRPRFGADGRVEGDPPAVLIGGRRCPLLGRVMMDYLLADVTEVPDAARGDRVTLFGRCGDAEITALDLARWAGTIAYEVVSRLGPRVRAVALDGGLPADPSSSGERPRAEVEADGGRGAHARGERGAERERRPGASSTARAAVPRAPHPGPRLRTRRPPAAPHAPVP